MAGVGRRGFAAAARAAMFVMPSGGSQAQPPRRATPPRYLGIDVPPTRCMFPFILFFEHHSLMFIASSQRNSASLSGI